MKMFEQTGEFQPDSLIASPDFPILTSGIGLKAGYGLLKRGSLIVKGADKAGYIAGAKAADATKQSASDSDIAGMEADETGQNVPDSNIAGVEAEETAQKVFGILTDDVETGEDASGSNIPATVYQTGVFNRAAVFVSGEDIELETYEDAMREAGMFLRSVQEAE